MEILSASSRSLQSTIENLLRATGRENVEQLLTLMRENDYYRVGCHRHHKYQGGLARHSLEVLMRMQRQNEGLLPTDSIIIVALLHDLCNINGFRHIRHHGYRSVILAAREAGFKLRKEEAQAILWHMHDAKEKEKLGSSFEAVLDSPLWKELRKADQYSAAHPLSREELAYAMEGKHRRVVAIREDHCVGSENHKSAPRPKEETPIPILRPDEDKRRQSIKRNNATIADIFEALHNGEIDVNEAYDWYQQQSVNNQTNAITSTVEVDNSGFDRQYVKTASTEEIEMHRMELSARCRYKIGAPKYVAMYIYKETEGVFDPYLSPTSMHEWLQKEFGYSKDRDSLYHAARPFSNYKNRK